MSLFPRSSQRLWLIVPILACGFMVWIDQHRMERVNQVSALAESSAPVEVPAALSPSGYAQGQRELIVPERAENSLHWIAQTQQMLARGEWRVRHVDYENAPVGRDVAEASPYRWWLGSIAWGDQMASGRPLGVAVERAALWSDPLLHVLLLAASALFVAWHFGEFAAALLAIGSVAFFPFAAEFLPGAPDVLGMAQTAALTSVLLLLTGIAALRPGGAPAEPRSRRWFVGAGIAGGIGLWIRVPTELPLLAGLLLGAVMATAIGRRGRPESAWGVALPWRAWAAAGALTIFAAYLAENFPAHLWSWRLDSIHPLYALAWLGGGELLARLTDGRQGGRATVKFRHLAAIAIAVAAVASVPVALWRSPTGNFLTPTELTMHLSRLPNSAGAANLKAWLWRDRATTEVWATVLPLLILVLAGWLALRRKTALENRLMLAVALGPVLVALGFAAWRLSWWSLVDSALLALLVAAAGGPALRRGSSRWLLAAITLLGAVPGIAQIWPPAKAKLTLTSLEAEELIERHLAHWLAERTAEPGAVVYASPHETAALTFYGGLRGLGTFAPENRAGFGMTLLIAGASTMEGAQALLQERQVRYLVLPSWDPFFDEFARLYLARNFSNRSSLLVQELRRWHLPLWLRPLPYQMPVSGGFEGQSVAVFEIVDEQSPVVAASRLAEYLVEIGNLDQAALAAAGLRRFPGDTGALAAQAQVQTARGDAAGFAQTLTVLLTRLSHGADRFLPWDRRVSLAIVLAAGDQIGPAREQTRRCVADLNEERLRALSTGSLFNLLTLSRTFGLTLADPKLEALALNLLPVDLRNRL